MLLKFSPFQTSKVWRFKDPDTSYQYSADSRENLVRLIVGYRANNQLKQIENLDVVLENYLCMLPENLGKCQSVGRLKRGLFTYLKGGIVLLQNIWYDKVVSDVEADRRAKQCTHCPLNVFPDRGPFVKWSDTLAEASVGSRKTMYHDSLGNCAACSCCLKAKVWYPGPVELTKEEEGMMRSVNCWQLGIKK